MRKNGRILVKNLRKSKFEKKKTCPTKYGCHRNVKLLGPRGAILNFGQEILGKVIKFGGVCFNTERKKKEKKEK